MPNFSRIRVSGGWGIGPIFSPELDTFDERFTKTINAAEGCSFNPSAQIAIGGSGFCLIGNNHQLQGTLTAGASGKIDAQEATVITGHRRESILRQNTSATFNASSRAGFVYTDANTSEITFTLDFADKQVMRFVNYNTSTSGRVKIEMPMSADTVVLAPLGVVVSFNAIKISNYTDQVSGVTIRYDASANIYIVSDVERGA